MTNLAQAWLETDRYLEAPSVVGRLRSLVSEQLEALGSHLDGVDGSSLPSVEPTAAAFAAPAPQRLGDARGALAALRAIALTLDETAAGHTVLHTLAP